MSEHECPPCVICGGPNDIGEVCERCANEHRDCTVAGAFESGEQTPHDRYGFDHPWEATSDE
jgi:hypothetical protein